MKYNIKDTLQNYTWLNLKLQIKDIILLVTLPLLLITAVSNSNLSNELGQEKTQNILLTKSVSELTKDISLLTKDKTHLVTKMSVMERNNKVAHSHNQINYIEALVKMEKKYKMPSGILQNIAYHESRYNPNAISHKGAIGIMQIHPRWHKGVNPYNPFASIKYGAKYLNLLYKQFGSWEVALAAWNWGQGNVRKYTFYKAPRETKAFIKNVMKGIKV